MSVIDLSHALRGKIRRVVPIPLDYANVIEPGSGGTTTRVDRLGSRWAFDFFTVPMRIEPHGGRLEALFDQAELSGALCPIRIPDFNVGAPGSPTIAEDTTNGRVLSLAGVTPHYAFRQRQWASVIVDGQRYLDRIVAQAVANADGEAEITLRHLIRVSMSEGDTVEVAEPKIEGHFVLHQRPEWREDRLTEFAFRISEAE
jgi:hypothetical protein